MKRFGKRLLTLALAATLVMTGNMTAYATNANNTTLIQREDEVEGKTKITPQTENTMDFTLSVKRVEDEFYIYRLTDVVWEKTPNGVDVVKVSWIPEVQTFIDLHTKFGSDTYKIVENGSTSTKEIYATPENLGEAEDTTDAGVYTPNSKVNETYVIDLLKEIRKDEALMNTLKTKYTVGYHGNPYDNTTLSDPSKDNSQKADGKAGVADNSTDSVFQYAYTVTEMPIGLGFIDVKSGVRTYQPVLVDLMPEQVGPTGNWYVSKNQSYSLKYEDAGISKEINGDEYDIVRDGEIVTFDIDFEVPKYVKGEDGNYEYTLLNVFDEMTQGFTVLPKSLNLTIYNAANDSYSADVVVTTNTNGTVTINETSNAYSITVAEDVTTYYAGDNQDVFYSALGTDGNNHFWCNIDGELVSLLSYKTVDNNAYANLLNAYNTHLTNVGKDKVTYTANSIKKREYTKSFIAIKFDYTKLMDQTNGGALSPDHIELTYDAIINDASYVGNDMNTNDVYLFYNGDSAGNKYISQDQIKAWTYGLNIIKVDGDSVAEGTPEYLAGAEFDLYRLEATYCGGDSATVAPEQADYTSYIFYTNANELDYEDDRAAWIGTAEKENTDGFLYKAIRDYSVEEDKDVASTLAAVVLATEDYSTLDKFSNKYGAYEAYKELFNGYVLPNVTSMAYQYVPVEVENCAKCQTKHYHVEAYSIFMSKITSEATAAGVTVTGLDPNTYLLVETMAPSGYHKLNSGLQFMVKKYDDTQMVNAGNTYKGFIDDSNKDVVDGIYQIVVENYEGLQLPSTGSMGTFLFTIIGIMMMLSAIVVIVIKSKKNQNISLY